MNIDFRSFINESKEQLDISIQAAGKYLTSKTRIEEFLSSNVKVEQKTDGVKLTVIKQSNNGNLDDYIIAYKGNILYSSEYNYQPNTKVKSESIGASQFKLVFKHFQSLSKNDIPVGTELFIEYLMSKPTLSSNYTKKHKMVLIGHSKSSFTTKYGKLKTSNTGFQTVHRDSYADSLKIDVPVVLFNGIMGDQASFEKGIEHNALKKEFNTVKMTMNWDNPELLLDDIRYIFLNIESKYGGKEEGVVLSYNDRLLKFQQDYQLDQTARAAIKMKYRESDPTKETEYWNNVKLVARELADSITVKSRKLDDVLEELALDLKRYKLTFGHSKKTPAIIKDDIQLNAKMLLIKSMKGNNNVLIIGKFRVLTKDGHAKMIKRAMRLYDNVVIDLVTSKDTKNTKYLREKMLRKTFPGIEIVHSTTGNLVRIINKSPVNINAVYAGTDRAQAYREMLKNTVGVTVKEMQRTDSDISASKVIENINDETYFKQNTPKEIHSMYEEIRGNYA